MEPVVHPWRQSCSSYCVLAAPKITGDIMAPNNRYRTDNTDPLLKQPLSGYGEALKAGQAKPRKGIHA